jgi:hypothetical protein
MKPDWKDAPEWATHLAMDCFGDWWWCEHEPEIGETLCGHGFAWQRETSESKVALAVTANEFVETSLEKRPDHIPNASKMMEEQRDE